MRLALLLLAVLSFAGLRLRAEDDAHARELVKKLAEAAEDDVDKAGEEVKALGLPGAPLLVPLAKNPNAAVRQKVAEIFGDLADDAWGNDPQEGAGPKKLPPELAKSRDAMAALLDDPVDDVRKEASEQLTNYKEWAAPVAKALVKALGDPQESVAEHAQLSLKQIGLEALPPLLAVLPDAAGQKNTIRERALEVLEGVSVADAATVQALMRLLDHHDLHEPVHHALIHVLPLVNGLTPAILKEAKEDKELRWQACFVLGRLGAKAFGDLDEIQELLKDPDVWVRAYAAVAIRDIVGDPKSERTQAATKLLQAGLDAEDVPLRRACACAVRDMDGPGEFEEAMTWLRGDADNTVRMAATFSTPHHQPVPRRTEFEHRPAVLPVQPEKPAILP